MNYLAYRFIEPFHPDFSDLFTSAYVNIINKNGLSDLNDLYTKHLSL